MLLNAGALVMLARQAGQRWAYGVFFGAGAVSAFLTLAALTLFARAGSQEAERLLHVPDTGVSACAYGSLVAAFALLEGRRRLAAIGALTLWLASGFVAGRLDVATAHTIAAVAGATCALGVPAMRRHRSARAGVTAL